MTNFTSNDLLLYILNETSEKQNVEIKKAISQLPTLKNEIEELQTMLNQLEEISIEPSEKLMQHTLKVCMQETSSTVKI